MTDPDTYTDVSCTECERLQKRLDAISNAIATATHNGCDDGQHCSCVPLLRARIGELVEERNEGMVRLDSARKELAQAAITIQQMRAAMNPPYKIGVEESGVTVDETIVWVKGE